MSAALDWKMVKLGKNIQIVEKALTNQSKSIDLVRFCIYNNPSEVSYQTLFFFWCMVSSMTRSYPGLFILFCSQAHPNISNLRDQSRLFLHTTTHLPRMPLAEIFSTFSTVWSPLAISPSFETTAKHSNFAQLRVDDFISSNISAFYSSLDVLDIPHEHARAVPHFEKISFSSQCEKYFCSSQK